MDSNNSITSQIRSKILVLMCERYIEQNIEKYSLFVQKRMNDETIEEEARHLMPFSEIIHDTTLIKHGKGLTMYMGFVLMHMDVAPDIYTFGLTLHVEDETARKSWNAVRYVAACQTFSELRAWIKSDDFKKEAEDNLKFALEDCIGRDSDKNGREKNKVQQTNNHDYGQAHNRRQRNTD